MHNTGHTIHWEAHIVSKEQNSKRRKLKEAMTIHKLGRDKTLNQDCGIDLEQTVAGRDKTSVCLITEWRIT